jgi:hypothetical protein
MPRGEVVVGGHSITKGYFSNEAKTNEVYKVSKTTTRSREHCSLRVLTSFPFHMTYRLTRGVYAGSTLVILASSILTGALRLLTGKKI